MPPKPAPSIDANTGLPVGYNFRPDWEVTPRQVKAMLDGADGFTFIDCRTPGEHQAARINGATLLPLQALRERVGELEQHRDDTIIAHCHHGGRSLQFAMMLRQAGFPNVKSMAGGIDVWSLDVDPSVPRY